MMNYSKYSLLVILILSISLVSAADFTPQGNITLRNVYNIQNATSITIGNGTVKMNSSGFFGWLNWNWLTNIPVYVKDWDYKLNATDPRYNETSLALSINATANTKAYPGNCPIGEVVQNTTTGGVQCVPVTMDLSGYVTYANISNQAVNYSQFVNLSNVPIVNSSYVTYSNISNQAVNYSTYSNSTTWWATLSGWVNGWFIKNGDNLDFNETKLNNSILIIASVYNETSLIEGINTTLTSSKSGIGNCADGSVVQNLTNGSPQCYTIPAATTYTSDEIWINKNVTNSFNFNESRLNASISVIANVSNYVPYSGATGNVDLGTKNITATWFKGLFNWISGDNWNNFNGSTLDFNETKLNSSINSAIVAYNTSVMQETFVKRSGDNMYGDFQVVKSYSNYSMFVSNTTYNGNLGGLEGADIKCQAEAAAGGLRNAQDYKAWLSNSTTSAKSRLYHSEVPYVRTDGALIANNWVDLTDGSINSRIEFTQFGVGMSGLDLGVMTGTKADGTSLADGYDCEGWTSNAYYHGGGGGPLNLMDYGETSKTDSWWTYNNLYPGGLSCAYATRRIYCVEQPPIEFNVEPQKGNTTIKNNLNVGNNLNVNGTVTVGAVTISQNGNVNADSNGNFTANWFFGWINWSNLQSIPAYVINYTDTINSVNSSWYNYVTTNYYNQTTSDGRFILQSNEGKLNVNNSDYVDGYHATYFFPLNTSVSSGSGFDLLSDTRINGGFSKGGISFLGGNIWMNGSIYLTGNISSVTLTETAMNGTWYPAIDNIFDLGKTDKRWANVYATNMYTTQYYGKYNWTSGDSWSSFDGSTLRINETKLNSTYVKQVGDTMTGNLNMPSTLINQSLKQSCYEVIIANSSGTTYYSGASCTGTAARKPVDAIAYSATSTYVCLAANATLGYASYSVAGSCSDIGPGTQILQAITTLDNNQLYPVNVINGAGTNLLNLSVVGDMATSGRVSDKTGFITPVGSVNAFAGSSSPTGWLLCNGANVSRTAYADLYAVVGTTYGAADGSVNFTLPDIRGRVIVDYKSTGTFNSLGKTGGEENHTLTATEMPSHTHGTIYGYNGGATDYKIWGGATINTLSYPTSAAGGDLPHNNLQPYIVLNYIIKY